MKKLLLIPFIGLVFTAFSRAASPELHEGDLVFQQSQSAQAGAILEATGSPWSHVGILLKNEDSRRGGEWVVAEAGGKVQLTPFAKFIRKGKDGLYRIYRARDLKPDQVPALYAAIQSMIGKPYDLYFEWSDQAIYCSELTYKALKAATGVDIGTVQKFSDLKLDGPLVQLMIWLRLTRTGRKLNPNEAIVTPISQMSDPRLDLILRTDR